MIRILKVLVVYAVIGAAVWYGVEPIRRTFLLPGLFTNATRLLVIAVLPFALGVAWRYPALVARDAARDAAGRRAPDRPLDPDEAPDRGREGSGTVES